MATFSTSCVFTEITPNSGIKEIIVSTPALGASGDTIAVTLVDHGISETGLLAISGFVQSTTASVITIERPTTAVAAGVLTITSGTGAGRKIYRILGKSN